MAEGSPELTLGEGRAERIGEDRGVVCRRLAFCTHGGRLVLLELDNVITNRSAQRPHHEVVLELVEVPRTQTQPATQVSAVLHDVEERSVLLARVTGTVNRTGKHRHGNAPLGMYPHPERVGLRPGRSECAFYPDLAPATPLVLGVAYTVGDP